MQDVRQSPASCDGREWVGVIGCTNQCHSELECSITRNGAIVLCVMAAWLKRISEKRLGAGLTYWLFSRGLFRRLFPHISWVSQQPPTVKAVS